MDNGLASQYILGNFDSSDRLAVVILNKRTGAATQRIASAERIAGPSFQLWLLHENVQGRDVYISMNALREEAQGRTKDDIGTIRHVYLDFDENGTEAIKALFKRQDLPMINYLVNTSPGKWQVVWQVEGFTKDTAESLQRTLARETGADPAATDCSRVLRLPGFYNHKYSAPYLVRSEAHAAIAGIIYRPEHFRDFRQDRIVEVVGRSGRINNLRKESWLSQSERDWAYAKRALSRGEPVASIIAAIAEYRRNHKPDPAYYAAHTVRKAADELAREQRRDFDLPSGPER